MDATRDLTQAQWLFSLQRYNQAADLLIQALTRNPEDADAHALLAMTRCALKQDVLAKHHANKAVELQPDNPHHWFVLSRVLIRFFEWEVVEYYGRDGKCLAPRAVASADSMNSLRAIEKAIQLAPEHPDYHAHLSLMKLLFARHQEAITAAKAGLQISQNHLGCLHYLSQAWLDIGETEKAEEAVRTLLSFDPNSAYGHAGMGDVALYRRKGEEAEQHFLEALRLDPLLPWPEQGLRMARVLETGRAFARELLTSLHDPVFSDPFRPVRQLQLLATIILCIVVAVLIAQAVSAQLWPGRSLFHWIVNWLSNP